MMNFSRSVLLLLSCLITANLPAASLYYWPDGYLDGSAGNPRNWINEYLPVLNPTSDAITGTLKLYFDDGQVIQAVRSFPPHTRSGFTLRDHIPEDRLRQSYGVILEAPEELAVVSSRYEGGALGTTLTSTVSRYWTFADARRGDDEDSVLALFNVEGQTAEVELTAYYEDGSSESTRISLAGKTARRLEINDEAWLHDGLFGLKIESSRNLVASLSVWFTPPGSDLQEAYSHLGTPSLGDLSGFMPEGFFSAANSNAKDMLYLLNPSNVTGDEDAVATIELTRYDGQSHRFDIDVSPGQLAVTDLRPEVVKGFGGAVDVSYTISYSATKRLTANMVHLDYNTLTSAGFSPHAYKEWWFAEGFAKDQVSNADPDYGNAAVLEFLICQNPTTETVNGLSAQFMTTNGTVTTRGLPDIAPRGKGGAMLSGTPEGVLDWNSTPEVDTWFGVKVTSPQPVVCYLVHYDKPQGGAFGTLGYPSAGSTKAVSTVEVMYTGSIEIGSATITLNAPGSVSLVECEEDPSLSLGDVNGTKLGAIWTYGTKGPAPMMSCDFDILAAAGNPEESAYSLTVVDASDVENGAPISLSPSEFSIRAVNHD